MHVSALAQAAQQRSRSRIAASSTVFVVDIDRVGARAAPRTARRCSTIIFSVTRAVARAAHRCSCPALCATCGARAAAATALVAAELQFPPLRRLDASGSFLNSCALRG